MTHYLITMKDGWKPGDCKNCSMVSKFTDRRQIYYCVADKEHCPLANAREAKLVDPAMFSGLGYGDGDDMFDGKGKPVKLYAVETKEKN